MIVANPAAKVGANAGFSVLDSEFVRVLFGEVSQVISPSALCPVMI